MMKQPLRALSVPMSYSLIGQAWPRSVSRLMLLLCLIGLSACEPSQESTNKEPTTESQNSTPSQSLESVPTSAPPSSINNPTPEAQVVLPTNAGSVTDEKAEELVESMGFADAQSAADDALVETPVTPKKYRVACNTFAQLAADNEGGESSQLFSEGDGDQQRTRFCKKISNRLASVSMNLCMSAQLVPSGCNSVGGVPLMVREFPPLKNKTPKGRVLIVGGTHGDELTSVSVTFRWLEKLNEHHSGLFHWRVIPAMNPDGLLKRAASRTNNNGIDLNRNMPSDDWQQNALSYWQHKSGKNPRRYPGEQPNSEPETQWLVDEINFFKPDAIIAVHAPYGVVDFDAHKLNSAPKSLGKLHLNLLGTYPGSLGNYAGINLNIPVVTLELPHSWEMPSERESDLIWQDIVKWLNKILSAEQALSVAE